MCVYVFVFVCMYVFIWFEKVGLIYLDSILQWKALSSSISICICTCVPWSIRSYPFAPGEHSAYCPPWSRHLSNLLEKKRIPI